MGGGDGGYRLQVTWSEDLWSARYPKNDRFCHQCDPSNSGGKYTKADPEAHIQTLGGRLLQRGRIVTGKGWMDKGENKGCWRRFLTWTPECTVLSFCGEESVCGFRGKTSRCLRNHDSKPGQASHRANRIRSVRIKKQKQYYAQSTKSNWIWTSITISWIGDLTIDVTRNKRILSRNPRNSKKIGPGEEGGGWQPGGGACLLQLSWCWRRPGNTGWPATANTFLLQSKCCRNPAKNPAKILPILWEDLKKPEYIPHICNFFYTDTFSGLNILH